MERANWRGSGGCLAQELPAHIYSTTGSENGLGGTVYAFSGIVEDYFSFTESELFFSGKVARLSPPLRTEEDRMAVIEGLQNGVIDAVCSDHTALPKDHVDRGMPLGSSGFETLFGAGITHLVLPGHLSLYRFLQLISTAPAKILGVDCAIKEGNPLDLVFIDPDSPMVYTHQTLLTRGFNTPFFGKSLCGRVTDGYYNGVKRGD